MVKAEVLYTERGGALWADGRGYWGHHIQGVRASEVCSLCGAQRPQASADLPARLSFQLGLSTGFAVFRAGNPYPLWSAGAQMMQLPSREEVPELRRRLAHALLMNMIRDPDAYLAPAPYAQVLLFRGLDTCTCQFPKPESVTPPWPAHSQALQIISCGLAQDLGVPENVGSGPLFLTVISCIIHKPWSPNLYPWCPRSRP